MKKLTDSSDESFDSSDDGITKKVTQSSKGQPKEKMKAKARKIDSDDSSDGIKTMPPKKKEAQGSSSGDQSDSSDHTPPKKNNRKGKELFSSSDEDEQIKGEEVAKSVGAKRINFGKLAADRLSGQVEKNSKNGSRKETKGSGKKETIDISDGSSDREEEKRDRVDNLKPGGSVTRAFGADKKKAQANKGYQSVNDLALAVATRKFAPDKRQMALRLTEGRHFDRLKVGELKPEKQNVITSNNF